MHAIRKRNFLLEILNVPHSARTRSSVFREHGGWPLVHRSVRTRAGPAPCRRERPEEQVLLRFRILDAPFSSFPHVLLRVSICNELRHNLQPLRLLAKGDIERFYAVRDDRTGDLYANLRVSGGFFGNRTTFETHFQSEDLVILQMRRRAWLFIFYCIRIVRYICVFWKESVWFLYGQGEPKFCILRIFILIQLYFYSNITYWRS